MMTEIDNKIARIREIDNKIARIREALIHYPYHNECSRQLDVDDLIETVKEKYTIEKPLEDLFDIMKSLMMPLEDDGYLDLTKEQEPTQEQLYESMVKDKIEELNEIHGCGTPLSNPFFVHLKCGEGGRLCSECEAKEDEIKMKQRLENDQKN